MGFGAIDAISIDVEDGLPGLALRMLLAPANGPKLIISMALYDVEESPRQPLVRVTPPRQPMHLDGHDSYHQPNVMKGEPSSGGGP